MAAVAVGTASASAGWRWATLLICFFVASSLLSRYRHAARQARVGSVIEKGDERDAWQVLANGGVFAVSALLATVSGEPAWGAMALGALAGATADTWATEVGTLAGQAPRSVVSFQPVAPGMSGGVTVAGTIASLTGAGLIAMVGYALGAAHAHPAAVFAGGVVGSLADSVAGGTIQERRWCDHCAAETERRVHECGEPARVNGGVRGVRNDLVNFLCTLSGGAAAVLMSR